MENLKKYNPFRTRYVACTGNYTTGSWTCKGFFDSAEEASHYSAENHELPVAILGTNNIWPDFIRRKILTSKLKPRVGIWYFPS